MWRSLWVLLLPLNSAALYAQAAPDGTPERAIQDMLLAGKPEEIEKHLPVATLDEVKTLSAGDRQAFDASMLVRPPTGGDPAGLEVPDDGHAFLVAKNNDAEVLEVHLTENVVNGADAVLRFAVEVHAREMLPMEVLVWMRLEDGEWRLREVNAGSFREHIRFDDPSFVERFRNREQKANESSAVSTLYSIHYALQRFTEVRPEVGFPEDLSLLAEPVANDEDDSDEPGSGSFLSAERAHNDFESEGYRFHYQLIRGGPQGAYHITARPLDPAKGGRFSYFIDESGQMRETREDRDATSDDPLLGAHEFPDPA